MIIAWMYILTNSNNTVLYVGSTNNLRTRVLEHKTKQNPKCFTAKYNVHKLIYFEEFSEVEQARIREFFVKKKKRDWKFELISRMNSSWIELDPELPRNAQLY
jgi:putative endonuclease